MSFGTIDPSKLFDRAAVEVSLQDVFSVEYGEDLQRRFPFDSKVTPEKIIEMAKQLILDAMFNPPALPSDSFDSPDDPKWTQMMPNDFIIAGCGGVPEDFQVLDSNGALLAANSVGRRELFVHFLQAVNRIYEETYLPTVVAS